MNRRVIKSILKKKFNQWIETIKDEKVKRAIKDNSIITGGSIVSLLLKEKVSDYDVYLTNFKTAELVAGYYVTEFNRLHEGKSTPTAVMRIEENRIRINTQSGGIAGENTPDSQYQYLDGRPVNEGDEYTLNTISEALGTTDATDAMDGDKLDAETIEKEPYRPVFLTDNAITLANQIQIVTRFYGEPEEIHKNYDFVHCTNYWVAKTETLVLQPSALEAILAKELVYVGSLYPVCSFIRTRKFIKRGWHINAGQMLKICLQISELNLMDLETLRDQLTGVDTTYFNQVIDYLKKRQEEDKELQVSVPYLISIIDKIF